MTDKMTRAAKTPMRERALARLQAGATIEEIAAELGIHEIVLRPLLAEAAAVQWPKPPAPATPVRRKPIYTKDGVRLGRAALWS